jgi:hypothetical protein
MRCQRRQLAESQHHASAFRNCTFNEYHRGTAYFGELWTTASLVGARVDGGQALAYAVVCGLRLDGALDA